MFLIPASVANGRLELDLSGLRKIILPETPTVPVGLVVTEKSGGHVELEWDNVGDAARWDVYRDGVYLATTTQAGYIDNAVQPSTSYSYQVLASNVNSSGLSSSLSVTTDANTTPTWSIGDQVAFIGVPYSLNLNSVCADEDGHTRTYTIISGSVAGLSISSTTLQLPNPAAVSSTNLTLRASDGFGTSNASIAFAVRDGDTTAPTVPTSVSASAVGATALVTWGQSTDANGIRHYKVYRDGVLTTTTLNLSFSQPGLANGSYVYSISAVDNSSNSNESSAASANSLVISVVNPTPDVPINVTAIPVPPSTLEVEWEQGTSGTAANPDDYDVQYSSTGANGTYSTWPHTGTALSTTITGLSAGTYHVKVRANNGANQSAFSTPVQAILTPTSTGANFTLTAQTSPRTWDGGQNGFNVQPGQIIELSSGTHGPILFQNIIGSSSNRILIRGPSTGTATIRSATAGLKNYIVEFQNCRHVDFDGVSTTTTAGVDGKKRNIKVMYSTSGTDSPTGFIKMSGTSNTTFTMTRNIRVKHVEIDGGWPANASQGIGIQCQDHSFKNANFPMSSGFWLEDIIFEDLLIRRCKGEGMYLGTNPYQAVRPNLPPLQQGAGLGLRYIKIRRNYVADCGGSAINPKSVFGGTAAGDGTTENSIHHNVLIRNGGDPAANGAASISCNSAKVDIYNNWIESGDAQGISMNVSEGTNVIDSTLTFTHRIYNNVVRLCGTVGINAIAHGTIPSAMQPTMRVFNNTVVSNGTNGISFSSNANSNSWARNNVCAGNASAQISDGPGTSTSNIEQASTTGLFVDSTGTYEAGDLDLNLQSASLASGTMGAGAPSTWAANVDIAPTDYDGDGRSFLSPDKGAYEF